MPLTEALAARLELAELVQRRRAATPTNREPGLVFPGERVVRLGVMDDPTGALPMVGYGAGAYILHLLERGRTAKTAR